MPSEPAQAMDVEPSITAAVPPSKTTKEPCCSPTPSETAKESCRHFCGVYFLLLKVPAKTVKDCQTNLKRKLE